MRLRAILFVLVILVMVLAASGVFNYFITVKQNRMKAELQKQVEIAERIRYQLMLHITENMKTAKVMARLPAISDAVADPSPRRIEAALQVLDIFSEALEDSICYLMDENGTTIASSNRFDEDSFQGENYAFRPYFQKAIAGFPNVYMAVGRTSGKRGIYYSQPVGDASADRPLGVIVIKIPIERMESRIDTPPSGDWALANPEGMVIAASRPTWPIRPFWKLGTEATDRLRRSRQFGDGPWEWLGFRESTREATVIDRADNPYLLHRIPLENFTDWDLYYLVSWDALTAVMTPGISGLMLQSSLFVVLAMCALLFAAVIMLYKRASDDIQQRIAAETALAESEKQYRGVFETTGTGTVLCEADMRLSMVNAEFEKMTGYAREEIEAGMKLLDFIAAEDHARLSDYHHRRRRGDADSESGVPQKYECRLRDREGDIHEVLVKVALIPGTPIGKQTSVVSFLDITERKAVENALRKSEERYRQFFESDFSGAYISNPEGRLIACNPAFARIFGFDSPEAAMSVNLNAFYVTSESRKTFLKQLVKEKRVSHYESEMRRMDGGRLHVLENSVGVFDTDGRLVEIRGYLMDITDQKRMEEQLRQALKMEAVGTLAGGVAHDFNNLLMAIEGNISLMLHATDPADPNHARLRNVERYVTNGARLTAQLLGYARKGQYEIRTIDINDLVNETVETISRARKDILVSRELMPDLLPIDADRGQIQQVLLNVCVNACDAMSEGGRLLLRTAQIPAGHVRGKAISKDRCYVMIEITDTGEGIDNDIIDRIFDPFFTTKAVGRGTGLGLASAYGIVESHNGHIHVHSTKGEGTTFLLYFPASGQRIVSENLCAMREIPPGDGTILVVDDEEMIREVAAQMLAVMGFSVLLAGNGEEALTVYERHREKIVLVILDMVMPGIGGGELYRRLRALNPELRALLSSGYSLDSQAKAILEQGCDGFIQKPFNMQALSDKIKSVMDGC